MISDERTILDLLAARDAAIAASDAEAAVAPLASDAVTFELQPPLQYAFDAAEAVRGLEEWFATWADGVRSDFTDPTLIIEGDLAVAYGLAHMTGDKKREGPIDLWFRMTVVLQRRDGEWRIVHSHESVPMMMDGSGKAATDLKPE